MIIISNGSPFFNLGLALVFSFSAGYFPPSLAWRLGGVIISILIALAIGSSQPPALIPPTLVALVIFSLPSVVGLLIKQYQIWKSESEETPIEDILEEIKRSEPIQIVQQIDNILNCLIGTNNVWVQEHWTRLPDNEKVKFVKENRERFNDELIYVENTLDMIQLLQDISRNIHTLKNRAS